MLNCKLYITAHTAAEGGRKLIIWACWMQSVVHLSWTPATSPCHCTLGTQRDVTGKNEVCSHLLINIALPLLPDHWGHLGLIKNVLNQSRRWRPGASGFDWCGRNCCIRQTRVRFVLISGSGWSICAIDGESHWTLESRSEEGFLS